MAENGTTPEWRLGEPLTTFEQSLVAAAADGSACGIWVDPVPDLDTMKSWGPERTVRAAVLRELIVGGTWPVHARGVQLHGARVAGGLDMAFTRARCPVSIVRCLFDSPDAIVLTHAVVVRLMLVECNLPGIDADVLVATNGFGLRGSTAHGVIRLIDADITGGVECTALHIARPDALGNAFVGDRMRLRGSLSLDGGFEANGSVRLHGCEIAGPLHLARGTFSAGPSGSYALAGDRMKVGGSMFLIDAATNGPIRFPGAIIGGQLACRGLTVDGVDAEGVSLFAHGAAVTGDVFLDGGFAVSGTVHLDDMRVGGSIDVTAARLDGAVAFVAAGARVEQEFIWRPGTAVEGVVNLEGMTVGRLADDWSRPGADWPSAGNLVLTGFTYGGFAREDTATVADRLDWIRRQYAPGTKAFRSQPYEQLIRVYRATGQDADARTVAIERRNDLRKHGEMTRLRRAWSRVLDVTIKHGYEPWRAVVFVIGLYAIVAGLFVFAQHQRGSMAPARSTPTPLAADAALHCRDGYPCFYPLTYALDLVVPIVDVPDADAWRPNGHAPWRWPYVLLTVLATSFGWGASTLAVLGYTGIVRRE